MSRSLTYQKYEFLFLYGILVGIWVFYALVSQLVANWVIVIQTIFYSYIIACFLIKENHRQIIHSLTCIIILLVYRIDDLIVNSVYPKILTEITTQIIFLFLKYGDSLFLFLLFFSMCVFQSLRRGEMKFVSNWFSIAVFIVLFFISFIYTFSSENVLLLDATTIQMDSSRISIVNSCSGIYGLIIFLSTFIFFVNVTRTNREFNFHQVLLSGSVGIIGIYLLNLFRILILILLTFYFPADLWSETHIYLGGIFIIGYLTIFWGIIWLKLPFNSS
ncbi:MAG: hypothetical protein ACFFC6_14030 [Promethearchaeota archaeon]